MTAQDALRQATEECQRFPYRAEKPGMDLWQTPRETEHYGNGDCDDAAIWTIIRAHALCPSAALYLVAGDLRGQGHAWVEMTDERGETWWCDPTPGPGVPPIHPRLWFFSYHPRYAYRFDGTIFGEKFAYKEVV